MTSFAKVVFDFVGQLDGELSVNAGDVVIVIDPPHVAEGWIKVRKENNSEGFVPVNFLEQHIEPLVLPSAPILEIDEPESKDYDISDFEIVCRGKNKQDLSEEKPQEIRTSQQRLTCVFNRSDTVQDYLLGVHDTKEKGHVDTSLIFKLGLHTFTWAPNPEPYFCILGAATRKSKFHGLKPFMTFGISPSFTNTQVFRSYKQFEWLHERLVEKFGFILPIPPLPTRSFMSITNEEIHEKRQIQLQNFTDKICRHPVLARAKVWKHFITEADDTKWTEGKRSLEEDKAVGVSFLATLPLIQIDDQTGNVLDDQILKLKKDITELSSKLSNFLKLTEQQSKVYIEKHSKVSKEIGRSFYQLGFSMPDNLSSLVEVGSTFQEISNLWENQYAKEWEPLQLVILAYKGITNGLQTVLKTYDSMIQNKTVIDEADHSTKEKKIASDKLNIYKIALSCEISNFYTFLNADMNEAARNFLEEKLKHQKHLLDKTNDLYKKFEVSIGRNVQVFPELSEDSQIVIKMDDGNKWQWVRTCLPYSVKVESPKRDSKFAGMKSFTTYQVTPSHTNYYVSRRYKHFDWLHQRLEEKYGKIIPIPPIPEKQLTGIFEEEFIEERKNLLASFAQKVCQHPILSCSDVWNHFLTQVDEKEWTEGKRKAEAEENVGYQLLKDITILPYGDDKEKSRPRDKIEKFSQNIAKLSNATKNSNILSRDGLRKYRKSEATNSQTIGDIFKGFGKILSDADESYFESIGACFQKISKMLQDEVSSNQNVIGNTLFIYTGIAECWKKVLKEFNEKLEDDSSSQEVSKVSIAIEAEISYFHEVLSEDIRNMTKVYLI